MRSLTRSRKHQKPVPFLENQYRVHGAFHPSSMVVRWPAVVVLSAAVRVAQVLHDVCSMLSALHTPTLSVRRPSLHRRCAASYSFFASPAIVSSVFAAQCVCHRVWCAHTGAICPGDVVVLPMDVQPATGSVHNGAGRQQTTQPVPGRGKSRWSCQAPPPSAATYRRPGPGHFSFGHATAGRRRAVTHPAARDNAVGVTLRMYLSVIQLYAPSPLPKVLLIFTLHVHPLLLPPPHDVLLYLCPPTAVAHS